MRNFTFLLSLVLASAIVSPAQTDDLRQGFVHPPDSTRPWVYWMWMDGNLTKEGITADLESMKEAGIGGVIICEVNVGVPRGPVDFMSAEWRTLFKHVVDEAERLGLEITLNAGPGWTGSGGPWVKPEQSMQHIVASDTEVTGPVPFNGILPRPARRPAFFGDGALPPDREKAKNDFYQDVAVLAFPAVSGKQRIAYIDEKALYVRAPYSSQPNVKPYIPGQADYPEPSAGEAIEQPRIVDLTDRLSPDGRVLWNVPEGRWSILRFGRTATGANTRPAPLPGLGLECDKLDTVALNDHFDNYVGALLREIGPRSNTRTTGWTMLHIDSWEMGSQNWTGAFRQEFQRRRGYDLLPYLPTITGRIVANRELSERFLWDLRQTANELVLENHATHLKNLGARYGFGLSIEPYDMTPCADMSLGSIADVPMAEFWLYGFNTSYSVIEATSIAHTCGRRVVAAESFTSTDAEHWQAYPGMMKELGDWAFCAGINRFAFHRYQHQPWKDIRPGMTMGPYGVHWERTETWWNMVPAYHRYLSRCQFMLRQGLPVADICYLTAEGAPQVFRPPSSAMRGNPPIPVRSPSANDPARSTGKPDRLGYNFDGIAPDVFVERMSVKDGKLVLPDGMSYRVLALPERETMTPALLQKIKSLVEAGATVVGPPPRKSPSLSGYPGCDQEIQQLAGELWGNIDGNGITEHNFGKGRVVWFGPPDRPLEMTTEQGRTLVGVPWVWDVKDRSVTHKPDSMRYFRRKIMIQEGKQVESAFVYVTADHAFSLLVNNQFVGKGEDPTAVYAFDISTLLRAGDNRIGLQVENANMPPDSAGIRATVRMKLQDSVVFEFPGWEVKSSASTGWTATTDTSTGWTAAVTVGRDDESPWKDRVLHPFVPEQYGNYGYIRLLLARMGIPPDFESSVPVRYTHRRDGEREIYFVANAEDRELTARCTFRVSGKQPELWDAVTGEIKELPNFEQKDGRTSFAIRFAPYQSFFVVYAESARAPKAQGDDTTALRQVASLKGPWTVSFDRKWGGPKRVKFTRLQDWSKSAERGIRYYSGLATYTKSFDLPLPKTASVAADPGESPRRLWLDLGVVKNLATVRLNGRDLGAVWCAPWRVDITGAVKAKGNRLEITVANLWQNRLIGDEQLKPDCEYGKWGEPSGWPEWILKNRKRSPTGRYAFASWKHFTRNSPLLPSGLLGPVVLFQEP